VPAVVLLEGTGDQVGREEDAPVQPTLYHSNPHSVPHRYHTAPREVAAECRDGRSGGELDQFSSLYLPVQLTVLAAAVHIHGEPDERNSAVLPLQGTSAARLCESNCRWCGALDARTHALAVAGCTLSVVCFLFGCWVCPGRRMRVRSTTRRA